MANEVEVEQKNLNAALDRSLNNAAAIITRNYLDRLESYEIVPPSTEDKEIDIVQCGKFYRLSKLVVNREENFLDKLTTIVNVASAVDCSIAAIVRSDGTKIDYYLGIVSKNKHGNEEEIEKRREANAEAFHGALMGNLVGSETEKLPEGDVKRFIQEALAKKDGCYAAVSGIVARRDEKNKNIESYVQGIENLVDSLRGQKYTIVMLADPVATSVIQTIRQGYELLHTQLATLAKSAVTVNESDTLSLSKSHTVGITEGISRGITLTQSKTKSQGKYSGVSGNVGIDLGITVSVGVNAGVNRGTAEGNAQAKMQQRTQQKNVADAESISSTKTAGRSLQLTYENRTVKALLDKIDKHLARLDECDSYGAFDCAAYVIAENRETALATASNYNALMRGQNSCVQASRINTWNDPQKTERLSQYIGALVHPRFYQDKQEGIVVTPASVISGSELAIQIGLPKKSVSGVTVIPMASFGRNVAESKNAIELGKLYHMGQNEGASGKEQKVCIDIDSLCMHTFITGSTGKGKSTTIYSILDKLMKQNVNGRSGRISFMVIEPAKGEYKDRFGGYDNVSVYGTNYKKTPLLKIDPFSFPDDIHVLEHIDRLIEIFNVCWPMYAAMPAVLKDSVERAYIVSGWNLETSECRYRNTEGLPLYPTFADVLQQVDHVMNESAYSADSKGDYKGALCTRLRSLTNGLYGQIFTSDELSAVQLFDKNVIIDLSRTGSSETKALIMGLLVMKLQEYRMAKAEGGNEPLKHVTVLEEAHNILKRTSTEQPGEGANLLGKSVEMLANSIAEMRTYGEGFIIADQAPGLMDLAVIRNTNTKIIFGLPDLEDRELVGRAAGLNENQILELAKLKTFVAAVYQNNWLEPVLCNMIHDFSQDVPRYQYEAKKTEKAEQYRLLEFLLLPVKKWRELDDKYGAGYIEKLTDEVYRMPISAAAKTAFIRYKNAKYKEDFQKFRGQVVYQMFNTDTVFELARDKEDNIEAWYECIKETLDPEITALNEADQRKIVAILTRERELSNETAETAELFNRLMKYI